MMFKVEPDIANRQNLESGGSPATIDQPECTDTTDSAHDTVIFPVKTDTKAMTAPTEKKSNLQDCDAEPVLELGARPKDEADNPATKISHQSLENPFPKPATAAGEPVQTNDKGGEEQAKSSEYMKKKPAITLEVPSFPTETPRLQKNSTDNGPQNGRKRQKPSTSSSRFRGVSWFKANQVWKAQITVNGKYEYLGYFDEEEDAAWAYDIRALQVHGRTAQLNFPERIGELIAASLNSPSSDRSRAGKKQKKRFQTGHDSSLTHLTPHEISMSPANLEERRSAFGSSSDKIYLDNLSNFAVLASSSDGLDRQRHIQNQLERLLIAQYLAQHKATNLSRSSSSPSQIKQEEDTLQRRFFDFNSASSSLLSARNRSLSSGLSETSDLGHSPRGAVGGLGVSNLVSNLFNGGYGGISPLSPSSINSLASSPVSRSDRLSPLSVAEPSQSFSVHRSSPKIWDLTREMVGFVLRTSNLQPERIARLLNVSQEVVRSWMTTLIPGGSGILQVRAGLDEFLVEGVLSIFSQIPMPVASPKAEKLLLFQVVRLCAQRLGLSLEAIAVETGIQLSRLDKLLVFSEDRFPSLDDTSIRLPMSILVTYLQNLLRPYSLDRLLEGIAGRAGL